MENENFPHFPSIHEICSIRIVNQRASRKLGDIDSITFNKLFLFIVVKEPITENVPLIY